MDIIKLKNINKKYNLGRPSEVYALKNINLSVNKGEMIAVIGPSGSGKSTLLHILGCLDKATEGEYIFEEMNIEKMTDKQIAFLRNKRIGFVLQEFGLLLNRTVIENISYPLIFSNTRIRDLNDKCYKVLEMIEISNIAKRRVGDLSGGQRQRVAIARALINDPDLILADEPTGALDSFTSNEILQVLKELNNKGKTIIMVTHDNTVASFCSRIISIKDGCLIL